MLETRFFVVVLFGSRITATIFLHPSISQTNPNTGRQPPPLYSVLYRIISKRRCILPRNCSLEKNHVQKVETDSNIPNLPRGSMIQYSYGGSWKWVIILPILVCIVQLLFCHMFLHSFIFALTTAFTWLSKVWTSQLSSVFCLSWDLSWCRVSFLKGDLQFSKLFMNTSCIGVW